ncbi:hypothetical protein BDV96DRAFT_585698 [Lophiotrema nucula]|uniref:Uncharacterized protein n=1 Tax=Lophiotrema nucula TaxID=690887 RepID=A0A6A5YQY2_9PLEO|nr:hypothetical protein BDV96DRAFT_585698 [Lophiotrema nucula]
MKQEEEHPTFVKIIGMLPMAMVSAVAQPAARYTDQAFNSVMQKLGLLSLDENKENQ